MPRRSLLDRPIAILGAYFPGVLIALSSAIVVASVIGAIAGRSGARGVLGWATLWPQLVLHGQVWRVATWFLFETQPIGLIFAVLILLFLGRDLVSAWGARRFLGVFFGLGVFAGFATLLVSLLWPDVRTTAYLGVWPIIDAMILTWAMLFPSRQLLLYFVLPVGGRSLVILTVAGTVLFALMEGVVSYLPHFAALAGAWLYVRGASHLLARWKMARVIDAQRRASHLRIVDKKKGNGESTWLH